MLDRIKQLENVARQLEPDAQTRDALFQKVKKYAETFLDQVYDLPTYVVTEDKGMGLYDSPISERPINMDEALALLKKNVDHPGLNPASGGHLGYIPGGGLVHSAFGDFLADITNRFAGIFFAGPGAVRMENTLLAWMANVVGYPADSAGNLTSGGSVANLIGVVTARDAHNLKARDFEKAVIYLSEQVHHSVDKAIRIAGLRECITRYVPLDDKYRMRADALDEAIKADKQAGLHPWLIIASAGTTDTGAIDPLSEIGEIAERHQLWFHLDGAYGAFFVLCDEGKKLLSGMNTSHSIVMDPHKGLFLPYGSGAVLVKDRQKLLDAHYYMPNYLQDTVATRDELSPADLSPELTKHFRGLRLWLPLKLLGVAPFRAALEEKLWLARYFYEQIRESEGFEVGPYPDLSVVTYRYLPNRGDADEFNRRLVEEIHKDGRVFLSSTILDGKFTLRLAVLAFRTHLDTIELTLEILRQKAEELENHG
ncbi:aminotransferase class I/II-fold pyridoxal phosphate-dependent enzyme [candidate division KSB1 bacterium]|nr:aminotransferase class I/II-fold pyridoxal phosphate-dependent enzyme [candidate division KSB1 bacterium]NIR69652.1 aminotransferase class I/II-fold pyridoxal phosphate-dependent enzyme [candidate division KSB1 bacterium]NIS22881.1 aminotransferase class I/II-fold pyridoxal phosphate-dependent enzyme [candidate division KSB1 bacterium]NIT69719.1 aminotransferase class I/II-fold pyridoxal phosphate-dependent enzyme [candidate division KSB1 bacterium]NIU23387.1 aminotransferase class I/II-fold